MQKQRRRNRALLLRRLQIDPQVAWQRHLVAAVHMSRQMQLRLWMQQWELSTVTSGWLKRWRMQNLVVQRQHSPLHLPMQPVGCPKSIWRRKRRKAELLLQQTRRRRLQGSCWVVSAAPAPTGSRKQRMQQKHRLLQLLAARQAPLACRSSRAFCMTEALGWLRWRSLPSWQTPLRRRNQPGRRRHASRSMGSQLQRAAAAPQARLQLALLLYRRTSCMQGAPPGYSIQRHRCQHDASEDVSSCREVAGLCRRNVATLERSPVTCCLRV